MPYTILELTIILSRGVLDNCSYKKKYVFAFFFTYTHCKLINEFAKKKEPIPS